MASVEDFCTSNGFPYEVLDKLGYTTWVGLSLISAEEFAKEVQGYNNTPNAEPLKFLNLGSMRAILKEATRRQEGSGSPQELSKTSSKKRMSRSGSSKQKSPGSESVTEGSESAQAKYQANTHLYDAKAMMNKIFAPLSELNPGSQRGVAKVINGEKKRGLNSATAKGLSPGECYFTVKGKKLLECRDPCEASKWRGEFRCMVEGCKGYKKWSPFPQPGNIHNLITHGESDVHQQALKDLVRQPAGSALEESDGDDGGDDGSSDGGGLGGGDGGSSSGKSSGSGRSGSDKDGDGDSEGEDGVMGSPSPSEEDTQKRKRGTQRRQRGTHKRKRETRTAVKKKPIGLQLNAVVCECKEPKEARQEARGRDRVMHYVCDEDACGFKIPVEGAKKNGFKDAKGNCRSRHQLVEEGL